MHWDYYIEGTWGREVLFLCVCAYLGLVLTPHTHTPSLTPHAHIPSLSPHTHIPSPVKASVARLLRLLRQMQEEGVVIVLRVKERFLRSPSGSVHTQF